MRRLGTWDLGIEKDRLGSCGFAALVQHVEVAGQGYGGGFANMPAVMV